MADVFAQSLPLLIWTVALAIPLFFLLNRIGKSRWWIVMALVPIVGGTVLLWIVTFSRWPGTKQIEETVS